MQNINDNKYLGMQNIEYIKTLNSTCMEIGYTLIQKKLLMKNINNVFAIIDIYTTFHI